MKFLRILLETHLQENFQLATKEWGANNDINDINQTINLFRELVNKNKVSGAERDINHWRKIGFDRFKQFVTQKKSEIENANTKGNRKKAVKAASDDILTIKKTDNMHLFIPLSKEASCFYAGGDKTPWCISTRDGKNYFYSYTVDAKAYVIFLIHQNEIYALVMSKDGTVLECQDKSNKNAFPPQSFYSLSSSSHREIFEFCTKNHDKIFNNLKNNNEKEIMKQFKIKFETPKYSIYAKPLEIIYEYGYLSIQTKYKLIPGQEKINGIRVIIYPEYDSPLPFKILYECSLENVDMYGRPHSRLVLSKISELMTPDFKKQILDFIVPKIKAELDTLQRRIKYFKDEIKKEPDKKIFKKMLSIIETQFNDLKMCLFNKHKEYKWEPLFQLYPDILKDIIHKLQLKDEG